MWQRAAGLTHNGRERDLLLARAEASGLQDNPR